MLSQLVLEEMYKIHRINRQTIPEAKKKHEHVIIKILHNKTAPKKLLNNGVAPDQQ